MGCFRYQNCHCGEHQRRGNLMRLLRYARNDKTDLRSVALYGRETLAATSCPFSFPLLERVFYLDIGKGPEDVPLDPGILSLQAAD